MPVLLFGRFGHGHKTEQWFRHEQLKLFLHWSLLWMQWFSHQTAMACSISSSVILLGERCVSRRHVVSTF